MLQSRFWQGFFALAPIIMVFLLIAAYFIFLIFMFNDIERLGDSNDMPPSVVLGNLSIFFIFIFLMIVVSFGSLIFYIVHAVKNPNLKHNNLLLVWILLFFFANGLGQLIYWLVEVIPKREVSA